MQLRILQLNLFQGKFLDEVIRFVKENDIDIVALQEVTGGAFSKGGVNHYLHREFRAREVDEDKLGVDNFSVLKERLSYEGVLTKVDGLANSPDSYFGNAILFKKLFRKTKEETIWLKDYQEHPNLATIDPAKRPRAATYLKLEKDGRTLQIINAHLAWGPTPQDKNYKREQAEKILSFIENINPPLIVTGDFNLTPDTEIVKSFSKYLRNLTVEYEVANTLNPNVHIVEELFPGGLAVDYILASKGLEVRTFRLIDEVDLSDHYALLAEVEI